MRLAPVREDAQGPRRLALDDDGVVAVRRQLAALEAQAGVPAREAVGVDEPAGAPFLVAHEQQRDLLEELRPQRQLAQDAEREDVAALHVDRARTDEVLAVALQRAVVVVRVDRVDVAEQHDAPGARARQRDDQVVGVIRRRARGALHARVCGRERDRDVECRLGPRHVAGGRGDADEPRELLGRARGDPLRGLGDPGVHCRRSTAKAPVDTRRGERGVAAFGAIG